MLEVTDLSVEYTSGAYVVRPLQDLSLVAEDGEFVVVVGPSGCGKTTLLSCLAGLLTPAAGRIKVGGTEVTALAGAALAQYRQQGVGVVFQAFNLIPSLSARENVMLPLRLAGVGRRAARARAERLLDEVGLQDRIRHRPREMSGGQQQRLAIARALVHDPPVVLADEPTAHLDYVQVEGVLRLLRGLACPGRLIVVVTHDDRIANIADRVIELSAGSARWSEEIVELTFQPDETIFQQGDRGPLIYFLDEGKVEIYLERADEGEDVLSVVAAGQYFGELSPMLGIPRSASARALTTCTVSGYSVRAFRKKFPAWKPEAADQTIP